MKANAATETRDEGVTETRDEGVTETRDEGVTVTSKLVGTESYYYPYEGREYEMGPERATYFKIYKDADGNPLYGDIIRIADDKTLERVYPDGSYEDYTVPALTKKQKDAFNDEYDPVKIKEREEAKRKKEEKELAKKKRKDFEYLVKENILTIQSGDNYILHTYWKPDKTIMRRMSSDINYGNTKENPYLNKKNITSLKKKITKTLKSHDLSVPIKVSIVPYTNTDFSKGLIEYEKIKEFKECKNFKKFNSKNGLHIVLFNNPKVSMEKQFEVQFKAYFKELQYID